LRFKESTMSKRLPVPKELERLIEKRDAEQDRRRSPPKRKANERRQRRRRKSDRG
jgi:hypothetical protein